MRYKMIMGILLFFCLFFALRSCGRSKEEAEWQTMQVIENAYNQGWYDALDCVKKKGGSAYNAAEDCEDE